MRPAIVLFAVFLAGCGARQLPSAASAPSGPATSAAVESASVAASSQPRASSAPATSSAIVGSWHRTILCDETRKAFDDAGLLESHADWACVEGSPPKPHSHFFTEDGQFGSHDPGKVQVDDGDYTLVDADTVSFPSHSQEFGFDPILVDFGVVDGNMTFEVQVPDDCTDKCADAYAWALSAFGTNPWEPGELPE